MSRFRSKIKAGKDPIHGTPGWQWSASQGQFRVAGWNRDHEKAEEAVKRARHLCQQTAALGKAWRHLGDTLPDTP